MCMIDDIHETADEAEVGLDTPCQFHSSIEGLGHQDRFSLLTLSGEYFVVTVFIVIWQCKKTVSMKD